MRSSHAHRLGNGGTGSGFGFCRTSLKGIPRLPSWSPFPNVSLPPYPISWGDWLLSVASGYRPIGLGYIGSSPQDRFITEDDGVWASMTKLNALLVSSACYATLQWRIEHPNNENVHNGFFISAYDHWSMKRVSACLSTAFSPKDPPHFHDVVLCRTGRKRGRDVLVRLWAIRVREEELLTTQPQPHGLCPGVRITKFDGLAENTRYCVAKMSEV